MAAFLGRKRPGRALDGWGAATCWRTHACMAIAAAAPALIDRVEPNCAIEQDGGPRRPPRRQPRTLLAEQEHAGARQPRTSRAAQRRAGCRPRSRRAARPRPTRRRPPRPAWWRTCWYRSVTIAPRRFQRRRPTTCTSAGQERVRGAHHRPDVEVVQPVLDRHVEAVPAGVEVGHDRLAPPVAVPVDDVAPVAVARAARGPARVVRPRAGPGTDADSLVTLRLVIAGVTSAEPRFRRGHGGGRLPGPLAGPRRARGRCGVRRGASASCSSSPALLVGFFLPGDTHAVRGRAGLGRARFRGAHLPLLAAGALRGRRGRGPVGYAIGSRLGRGWLRRRQGGRRPARTTAPAPGRGVLRALGLVGGGGRALDPVGADVHADRWRAPAGWAYGRFLSANVVGALAWAVGLTVLGHYAASQPALKHASYAVAGVFIVGSLVVGVVGWLRRREASRQ